MAYVVFDLEWNSGYCKKTKGFINEIIELGAVKLDEELNIIGQFSVFIRPQITRRLNAKVRELTHLSNEDLVHGATFGYAVSKFGKFAKDCVVMSWSTSDLDALEANCEYYFRSNIIPFLKRYADVQAYCQDILGLSPKNQLALQGAAELLELEADDLPHHRALGDSILTARILKKLYQPSGFEKYIKTCDDEFYARLNFRSVFLCNIDNPLVDKDELYLDCGQCGARCEQLEEFKARNKGFCTVLRCLTCNALYTGKVQFRLTYDGVVVTKKLSPYRPEEEPGDDTYAPEE